MSADLRFGLWQDVLADVECDALITDPPFGARTHEGDAAGRSNDGAIRIAVSYEYWTPADVAAFVASWSPRVRSWMVCLTSHDLIPAYEAAYAAAGRFHFAPVPCVIPGMTVRRGGDGPASWAVYAMAARPKTRKMLGWGALPGAYITTRDSGSGGGRGKPLDLMRALVKDYSRPGDLVCDPCAGFGTTLRAAIQMGRRAVGAECDSAAFAEAVKRCGQSANGELFTEVR